MDPTTPTRDEIESILADLDILEDNFCVEDSKIEGLMRHFEIPEAESL